MPGCFPARTRTILLLAGLVFFFKPTSALAQEPIPLEPDRPGTNPAEMRNEQSPVHVYVTVREATGLALDHSADVTLNCPLAGVTLSGSAKNTSPGELQHNPGRGC